MTYLVSYHSGGHHHNDVWVGLKGPQQAQRMIFEIDPCALITNIQKLKRHEMDILDDCTPKRQIGSVRILAA